MTRFVLMVAVAALLLTGCGQSATATTSSSPTAIATPTATATPAAIAKPIADPTPFPVDYPSSSPAATARPIADPTAPTTPQPAADPGREICSISEASGSYYRLVISQSEHNLSACNGGARFAGTIDDLLNVSGVDRRCIADSNAAIARFHAFVAVYSDTSQADLAAANAFCQQVGATMG